VANQPNHWKHLTEEEKEQYERENNLSNFIYEDEEQKINE
jgi:hypothetical protein